MTSASLRIFGVPMPQGSKTAFVRGGRAVLTDGRNAKARSAHAAWRQAIATAARDELERRPGFVPFDSACVVHVDFLLVRPKSIPKKRRYPETSPDIDKLERALLDGLTDGGLLINDARVVEVHKRKLYAVDEPPGAKVSIHHAGVEQLEHTG